MRTTALLLLCVMARGTHAGVSWLPSASSSFEAADNGVLSRIAEGESGQQVAQDQLG